MQFEVSLCLFCIFSVSILFFITLSDSLSATGTLSTRVSEQLASLRSLHTHLSDVASYLHRVTKGELPVNHQIIYHLQDTFSLLPNVSSPGLLASFAVKTNDQMLVLYLSALVRSILSLHSLIENKITNRDAEKEMDGEKKKKEAGDKEKEKEKAEAAEKEKEKTEEKK